MHRTSRSRLLAPLAIVVACLLPLLAACSSGDDAATSDGPATEATADAPAAGEAAAAMALEDGRIVIDVRTPEEFDAGHIEGAALLNFQGAEFADQIAELSLDGQYVVYCRSGNRSAQAATQMRELGLDVLDGGAMTDMEAAGWPVAP